MPRARNAFTVCMQSSLGRKPRKVQTPLDNAAMMAARCEMLLSPGTAISASTRGPRFIRNSMESILQHRSGRLRCAQPDHKQHRIEEALVQRGRLILEKSSRGGQLVGSCQTMERGKFFP